MTEAPESAEIEMLLVVDERGRRHVVRVRDGATQISGAILDSATLLGSVGRVVTVGRKRFLILPARTVDLMQGIERGPQTIGPKDAGAIVLHLGLRPGMRVLEIGAGSGSLTIALASAVSPGGRVFAYERRQDVARLLRGNLAFAGLEAFVEIREEDVSHGVAESHLDAAAIDIPEPGKVLPSVSEALTVGATIATFVPTAEQVRSCVSALADAKFVEIRTIEVIERDIEAKESGVRPSFARLGHTGYLTFARKALEPFP